MIMIEFKNVSYTYFNNFYTLFNFSYTFDEGNYCLIGDYDCGNLTLIRLLAKLDYFYKGEILINGKSLKKVDYKKEFNIAYIPQTPVFFNNKSVKYNLTYPLSARGIKKDVINQIVSNVLQKYNWQDKAKLKIKTLTKTERQILAIMRADTRPLDLLLVEDIFSTDNSTDNININNASTSQSNITSSLDTTSFNVKHTNNIEISSNITNSFDAKNQNLYIKLINNLSAKTKIIISKENVAFENFKQLNLNVSKIENKPQN